MPERQLIRVTVCARRNPKLSEDEFEDHWKNKHGPLITSWLKTYGCVKYVQYRTSSAHKSRLTLNTMPYDGIADFWYKSYEDFEKAYEDEYYLNVVKKDEEYLFDMASVTVTTGTEHAIIEDGKVVRDS
ncbi:hypothetical protein HBI56_034270 [Parastagonospora nodorum]|nr:hypothetical protein HBH51_135860 [Parastagonospora nodorum]KAH3990018.1 hypothetical protein HBH52_001360 [Parastagonospora nodorum]KAH4006576.1 hypothetical protein HBI10_012350 [Parastagonospora nodorum]KAH4011489.1 hypothetical protein HBI13_198240 [Parastagonospora nodorum]KAH4034588.1 hypothetical protein HBI09_100760 [Parastagonospora nodorum]